MLESEGFLWTTRPLSFFSDVYSCHVEISQRNSKISLPYKLPHEKQHLAPSYLMGNSFLHYSHDLLPHEVAPFLIVVAFT